MAEENLEQNTFPRQRRNLFLVSAALIAALHTDLTIEQVNFFGNHLALGTPLSVATPLWWLWGYWLLRFLQAFFEIHDRGVISTYTTKVGVLLSNKGYRAILKERRTSLDLNQYPEHRLSLTGYSILPTVGSRASIRCRIHVDIYRDGLQSGGRDFDEDITFHGRQLLVSKVLAFLWVVCCTTRVTEYLLPFAVGIAPLVVWWFEI